MFGAFFWHKDIVTPTFAEAVDQFLPQQLFE